jgi:GNAT superfamily N-acetyltransferase
VSESDITIDRHLHEWLGAWPSPGGVDVVGSAKRLQPGWDGAVTPLLGVLTPSGGVVSVAPSLLDATRQHLGGRVGDPGSADESAPDDSAPDESVLAGLPAAIGLRGRLLVGLFRFTTAPTGLPDAGIWRPADDRAVPDWLRPFGGEVLVALDDHGRYLAGVGLKRHDPFGQEIAVGTEPAARGQGLARRLVAQAARAVLAHGAVPTYIHAFDNLASGRVAEAAGFPDRGWRSLGVFGGAP